jgi:hypothetical protein
MSCRRVFSKPCEAAGKGSLHTGTYNKNYNYYKLLESGKQVVGPVSTQAPLDWRLGK